MANINRVVLVGNLTRDPELRHTPSGTAVCGLRLAVNTRRKDGATGEWTEKPNYFDITVWGNQGENCAQYLAKGRPVAIDGRLEWREWEAQDGSKRQAVEVIADTVQFLGGRDGGGEGGQPVRPERPPAGAGRRFRRSRRRRHPVLGGRNDGRKEETSSGAASACRPSRADAASRASSARARSTRSTTRTSPSCAATSPRRGRSARGGSAAPAAATSARSLWRSSAPARWHCCPTSPRAATTARAAAAVTAAIAATGGSGSRAGRAPSGRRQPRPAGRGRERRPRLRAQLPAAARPRRAATPGLVRELERRDEVRARHEAKTVDEARAIAERLEADGAPLRRQRRPDRIAVRLGDGHERRRPALGGAEDPHRPAQARADDDQADRALHGRRRGLRRRHGLPARDRRTRGPRAAARGGARGRGGRRGGRRGRSRTPGRPGAPRGRARGRGRAGRGRAGRGDPGRVRGRGPRAASCPTGSRPSRSEMGAVGVPADLSGCRERL